MGQAAVVQRRQIVNLTWFNNYTRRVVALIYWNGFECNWLFEIENKAYLHGVRPFQPCWHPLSESFCFKEVSELRHLLQLITSMWCSTIGRCFNPVNYSGNSMCHLNSRSLIIMIIFIYGFDMILETKKTSPTAGHANTLQIESRKCYIIPPKRIQICQSLIAHIIDNIFKFPQRIFWFIDLLVTHRSLWPRGVTRGLRPLACWDCRFESRRGMDVYCECCVFPGRGPYDGPITRTEVFYWVMCLCDRVTSYSH